MLWKSECYDFACARIGSTGRIVCWGDNSQNQLDGNAITSGAVQLSVGLVHACALVGSSQPLQVQCWGYAGDSSLDGGSIDNPGPSGGSTVYAVYAVSAGYTHTCIVVDAASDSGPLLGVVWCWGNDGTTDDAQFTGLAVL